MNPIEKIILVNKDDVEIGSMEKIEAHKKALLHRAFSIFIFNSNGELLLQKRDKNKYHSPNLWTNTCCSHPNHGEEIEAAVKRRLKEEMGMEAPVEFKFKFIYKVEFENNLTEHEIDHVYFGVSDKHPKVNPQEVSEWKYMKMENIKQDLLKCPEAYTYWFKICFPKVYKHFNIRIRNSNETSS